MNHLQSLNNVFVPDVILYLEIVNASFIMCKNVVIKHAIHKLIKQHFISILLITYKTGVMLYKCHLNV